VPTVAEVADELGVSEDEVLEAMEVARAYRGDTIDAAPADSGGATVERHLGTDDEGFDLVEHRVLLERVLDELPERERMIVELRFFHDKTQSEIARAVGISQMHVSRLLTRVLGHLRDSLKTLDA
jgi:RNA polymerase sigma-B factor